MDRFWSKVLFGDGCWEWTASKDAAGRGHFAVTPASHKQVSARAYRFAWLYAMGEDPGSKFVCHRCDNPSCVRPDHLFLGTSKDNTHDMIAKGRARMGEYQSRKTHCKHGHPFDDANTTRNQGQRHCRACQRIKDHGRPRNAKNRSRRSDVNVQPNRLDRYPLLTSNQV